jgi:hypothetical protein
MISELILKRNMPGGIICQARRKRRRKRRSNIFY